MKLPNGEVLMHASAPYDPKKAHEYYLRTRKLKGRKKGAQPPPKLGGLGARSAFAKPKKTQVEQLSPKQKAELKAYAQQKVQEAQKKLNELNKKLKEKMAEAQKAERDSKKPKTAGEKAKDAREAKKYRQSHKTELKTKAKADRAKSGGSSDKGGASSNSVEGLKKQVAAAEANLNKVKAKLKALA